MTGMEGEVGDDMGDAGGRLEDGSGRRLSWLTGRRVQVSRRYSRFVGMMKLFLPALAAVLILAVIAWPGLVGQQEGFPLSFSRLASDDGRSLTMVRPRYVGTDSRNRPFTVIAESATQDGEDQRLVSLEEPRARMTLQDGSALRISAETGFYNQGRQTLDLDGPVDLFSESGYEFHAKSLHVDLEAGTARSEQPVRGSGPFGTVRADRLLVTDKGQRLHFEGGVSLVLHPQQTG